VTLLAQTEKTMPPGDTNTGNRGAQKGGEYKFGLGFERHKEKPHWEEQGGECPTEKMGKN